MADRRRWSPESSSRRRKERKRSHHDEPPARVPSGIESLSSSSSSSYIDISRTYPKEKSGFRAFFTAPSERRRLRKRRSSRLGSISNSSSSSVNSDLAYGTGFVRRSKRREVRSRKGKDIDRERERNSARERDGDRPGPPRRATTDAEILAVGEGLAKLAREQNKSDLRSTGNARRLGATPARDLLSRNGYEAGRGLGPSKPSHKPDKHEDDGWESASDAGSDDTVDSKLAFGNDSGGGWFGWGKKRYEPLSRKPSVVDPTQFGPANSLHGIVTEPVGFGDVVWNSSSDFGQPAFFTPERSESTPSGSQAPLQNVYPIPTSDPSRFEAARSSVVSGSEPYVSSRPGGMPIQQPQPITPVSQSVYEPTYPARAGSPNSKKSLSSTGGRKSLAGAALAGVAGAAAGAAITSSRRDERTDKRRDAGRDDRVNRRQDSDRDDRPIRRGDSDRDYRHDRLVRRRDNDRDERLIKRNDSDKRDSDDKRREKRDSVDRDDRRERHGEKDKPRDSDRRDKDRKEEEYERRRAERRYGYEDVHTRGEASTNKAPVNPFQYQVEDDAFATPKSATPNPRRVDPAPTAPTVVTVEREPDFSRKRSSPPKQEFARSEPEIRRDYAEREDKEQSTRGRDRQVRTVRETEPIYEAKHSTAPVVAAAISATVAAASTEGHREERSDRRRDERRSDYRDDDYRTPEQDRKVPTEDHRDERSDRRRDERRIDYRDDDYRTAEQDRKVPTEDHREERSDRRRDERRSDYRDDNYRTPEQDQKVPTEDHREARSDGRRDERRSEYQNDDYRTPKQDQKVPTSVTKPERERDPVQEEADRAYREIIMARKIASQVIRSRTPSPDRSVVKKYEDEEPEIVRIVTPPGMHEEKKQGPYDAPNADFNLDHVLEDPKELRSFSLPHIELDSPVPGSPSFKLDPDASRPRPFLNLVRPTPNPSPMPEKQAARSKKDAQAASTAQDPPVSASDIVLDSKGNVVVSSPTSSTVSKGVTWGENETKHYEVESPGEHKDEFVSEPEAKARDNQTEEPKPSSGKKKSAWGTVFAGLAGVGAGAAAASSKEKPETSEASKSVSENEKDRGSPDVPVEYRGVAAEPESSKPEQPRHSPPATEPSPRSSHIPGAFDDDLDFAATVAAGLQDTGFDPDIVINDPSFRRRESPPGSNGPGIYRTPFAETVTDLGLVDPPAGGFVMGEVPSTPKDWQSTSPDKEDIPSDPISRDIVEEEPDTYFETPKLSKKEQKKRDKAAAQKRNSQTEDVDRSVEPVVTEEAVDEPETYFDAPDAPKSKKSKRASSTFDDADVQDDRKFSVPIDAFDDLRQQEDEWSAPKKSKKKSKRDSERYDSPARSISSENPSNIEGSSTKKSKDKSRHKSDLYEPELNPTEISLPPSTASETSRERGFEELEGPRNPSSKSTDDFEEPQPVEPTEGSWYEEEPRKGKKKSKKGAKDNFDDTQSVASAPAGDEFEYSKKSKKKDKRKSGSSFSAVEPKPEIDAEEESPKWEEEDFREIKKKTKKSKKKSALDESSPDSAELARASSNGNGHKNGSHSIEEDQEDSFLANAGILGAGAGVAGAAVVIAAQHHQQSKADNNNRDEVLEPIQTERSASSLQQQHETFESDVSRRQSRPSIDPQYGDLLLLPPSDPVSPNLEPLDDLPELPESRPDTPESERLAREIALGSARKNLHEGPIKSPSQSSVPLKFYLGNRSVPSSPGVARASPLQSPITPSQESLSSPRNRPRPTSWDSTNEYKPLYLVETNRRNSIVQSNEPEGSLPELPPSQDTSRAPSELGFDDQSHDQYPSDMQGDYREPLSIDTVLSTGASSDPLGSQQSTPKARIFPDDSELTRDEIQALSPIDRSIASPLLEASPSLDVKDNAEPPEEHDDTSNLEGPALASSIGYFPSSVPHQTIDKSWLDELPSHSMHHEPSPVEPTTKNRSSYLLHSSPPAKGFEDSLVLDHSIDSASDHQSLSYIQEREGSDIFGQTRGIEGGVEDDNKSAPDTASPRGPLIEDVARHVVGDDAAMEAATIEPELESTDTFLATPSKKDKKKDKKKSKKLSRSSTADDVSLPESSQPPIQDVEQPEPWEEDSTRQFPEESQPELKRDLSEESFPAEPSLAESKKNKKKDKKKGKSVSYDWQTQQEESAPQPSEDTPIETSQDLSKEPPAADAVGSKGKKKKDKKKGKSTWESLDEESVPPPTEDTAAQDSTKEELSVPDEPSMPDEPAVLDGPSTPDEFLAVEPKKKKKDKKKAKSTWESIDEESAPQPTEDTAAQDSTKEELAVPDEPAEPELSTPDEFSAVEPKKKKKDKKKGKLTWESVDEESAPQPTEDTAAQDSTMEELSVPDEPSLPAEPKPSTPDEFSAVEPKKKKKDKKKGKSVSTTWESLEEESVPQPAEEPTGQVSTREISVPDESSLPEEPPAADEFSAVEPKSKKKKDKKSRVVPTTWESLEEESLPQPTEDPANQDSSREISVPDEPSIPVEPSASDEFVAFEPKTKKKGKKKSKSVSFASDLEEESALQSSGDPTDQEVSKELSAPDEFSAVEPKPKKGKKKGKSVSLDWAEPLEEESAPGDPAVQDNSKEVSASDEFVAVEPKAKKKGKKKGKSVSLDWEAPEEENVPGESANQEDSREPSASDEFIAVESKPNKKGKKKGKSAIPLESEAIDTTPSLANPEPSQETIPESADLAPISEDPIPTEPIEIEESEIAPSLDPRGEERPQEPQTDADRTIPRDVGELPVSDEFVPTGTGKEEEAGAPSALEPEPGVSNDSASRELPVGVTTVEPAALETEQVEGECSNVSVVPEVAEPVTVPETQEPEEVLEFSMPGSKKGKKKGKKSQAKKLEDTPTSEASTSTDRAAEQPDTSAPASDIVQSPKVADVGFEQVPPSGSKKNKKKSKKSLLWEREPEPPQDQAEEQAAGQEADTSSSAVDISREQHLDADMESLPLESKQASESLAPAEPTPMVEGDAKPAMPAASSIPADKELPDSFSADHSLAATALLPVATVGATLASEDLMKKDIGQDDADISNSPEHSREALETDEAKPAVPDGLKAGYDNEQLSLARRLQEEFSSGSKKSKKGKKKQQSLPSTPDREVSRSRGVEEVKRTDSRARSLSTDRSIPAQASEDKATDEQRKSIYAEEQLELARQLKAEFESGSKKSKKDKKKRRSMTYDDDVPEPPPENPDTETTGGASGVDSVEATAKGDGLSAGYQEDQLSLARQLQAEFGSGSKKSKKDKKRKSTSVTPTHDSEVRDDYFEEPQPSVATPTQNDDVAASPESSTINKDTTRDGLTVGYSEDQLELARQLKEEFGSRSAKGAKKDKKDKKRMSQLRDNTDYASEDTSGDPERPRDASADILTSTDADTVPDTSNLDVAEAGTSGPATPDPEDESGFISKKSKKGKKGKQREGILASEDVITPQTESSSKDEDVERDIQTEADVATEPPTANPEDDFTPATKKTKKGKKGKKQEEGKDIFSESRVKDDDIEPDVQPPLEDKPDESPLAGAEDDFVGFAIKKTKKGKKGKKQESTIETEAKDLDSGSVPRSQDVEPVEPEPLEEDKAIEPAVGDPEVDFAPVKKSKKGKKGKKQEVELVEPDVELLEEDKAIEPAVDDPEDDFAPITKKSKKGKKGKKQEPAVEAEAKDPDTELASTSQDIEPEVEPPQEDEATEHTTGDLEDDFEPIVKKSKKGKKGKKQEDIPAIDATDPDTEPASTSQDIEPEVEPPKEDEAIEHTAGDLEDNFAPIIKKSKKGKKGKKQEDIPATDATDIPSQPIPTVDSVSKDEDAEQEAKTRFDQTSEPPAADSEDIFAPITKKSKKGKKGKKQESSAGIDEKELLPEPVSQDNAEPSTIPLEGEGISEPVADIEEDFAPVTKKSKKGKKGKKNVDRDDKDLPQEDASQDKDVEVELDPKSTEAERSITEPASTATDDLPVAKPKEDKLSNEPQTVQHDIAQEATSSETPMDQVVQPHLDLGSSDLQEKPGDDPEEVPFAAAKSKKSKKKRQNLATTETTLDLPDSGAASSQPIEEKEQLLTDALASDESIVVDRNQPDLDLVPEEPKDLNAENDIVVENPPQQVMTEEGSHPIQEYEVPSGNVATDAREGVDNSMARGDKDHGADEQSPIAPVSEDATEHPEQDNTKNLDPIGAETLAKDPQIQGEPTDVPESVEPTQDRSIIGNTTEAQEDAPDNTFEDFAIITKKSKKDKKKRKGLSKTESEEQSGASTPLNPVLAPVDSWESQSLADSLHGPEAQETPEPQSLQDSTSTRAVTSEVADEPNDEWNTPVKKSKKDKKKRKSGLSTPIALESEIPITEPEKPSEAEASSSSRIESPPTDQDPYPVDTIQELPLEPEKTTEAPEFSLKKSKKDKKKAKSGAATPIEEPLVVDPVGDAPRDAPAESKSLSSPSQLDQPDTVEINSKELSDDKTEETDFGFATKKSKKNKKAKKGNQATPSGSGPGTPKELSRSADFFDDNLEGQVPLTQESLVEESVLPKGEFPPVETSSTDPNPEPIQIGDKELATDTPEARIEAPSVTTNEPARKVSKKDKRKRQATVDSFNNNEAGSAKAEVPPVSWADEVEEAEVERDIPVIEDIAKDEALSHIASTTHSAPFDDFSRPTKKGKKGKKKEADAAILPAAAAALAGAVLGSSKPDKQTVEEASQPVAPTTTEPPKKKLSKKEKRKMSIDRRPAPQDDLFDDPALWEGADPKEFEEAEPDKDAGDDDGDGFWTSPDDKAFATGDQPQADEQPYPRQQSPSEQPPSAEASTQDPRPRAREIMDFTEPPTERGLPSISSEDHSAEEKHASFREESIEYEPVTPVNTGKYSHPGSSALPVVQEESPGQSEPEKIAVRPPYFQSIDDANRDSALVTESPIPQQRGFTDDDVGIRDSGVHLHDSLPSARELAPAASTDDAISRMAWPAVDEDRETVDLRKSQRPRAETQRGGHDDRRETTRPEQSRSSPRNKDIGFEESTQGHRSSSGRDSLPSQRLRDESSSELHRTQALRRSPQARGDSIVKQYVQRIESPDSSRPPRRPEEKYGDLNHSRRPRAEKPSGSPELSPAVGLGIAGAPAGFAAARQSSREQRPSSAQSTRSPSNINRLRTPEPKLRPESVNSNRSHSSATPPLRRSDRKIADLRSLGQRSKPDLAKEAELAAITAESTSTVNTANPTANEGRARAKDMADVYDGFGEGRMGSPRSPTRPHSMRRRQSMQVLDLESKLDQLATENRLLAEAKTQAEQALQNTQHTSSALVERDAEIDGLKRTLDWLQNEVTRLTEVNDGLTSANITIGNQHNERYGMLESQHVQTSRELQEVRDTHNNFSAGMESIVADQVQNAVQDKDREIAQLRADLEAAKNQIREMQRQILASKANDSQFLVSRDEDYFDGACQKLCQHVQQWVLRFSKFSDMRACRLTSEINNDKTIDRLDNAILDGSDVDTYLADRVKRRDVFMSMTMTMVWEFVFTRYLFGMDREQRQKLKSLEKLLSEVGPASAVHQWRATTLTLLSKREAFAQQREQDTLAVVHAVMEILTEILPPPSHLEDQIQEQLVRVMKAAVDLSIEMRTQRAEYMMLPPLQPEYDANGDLASKVSFNAALMNERSGNTVSNEELEASGAVVKIVLFPLVVKRGDDSGEGDEEIVVCPAQVLVAKPRKSVRLFTPESSMAQQNHSRVSMQSSMPMDQGEGSGI